MQFYYHLNGDEIGDLSLKLVTPFGLSNRPIWQRNIQHGNIWLKAHITLTKQPDIRYYRLLFEGVVGRGSRGSVAIDEIVFQPNQRCSPVAEISNLVNHYCDFENEDVCGYQIVPNDKGAWARDKPNLESLPPVYPAIDNTYQTEQGHFIQLKVNYYFISIP